MAEGFNYSEIKKYKFRELKVYSSTEWLADNKKKYRQVFDRYEVTYIYAELSFINKLYDIEDWDVDVELRCYSMSKKNPELCILPFKRKVSKFDNICYIREGWGNKKEGTFWKKGTYYWEAWIDGEKVANKYFYVEEASEPVTNTINPYLELHSLKLYEGPYDDVLLDDRNYYRAFNGEETRYIYVEATLANVNYLKAWQCELFFKFYNDARELKGQVIRLHKVEKKDSVFHITAGWGANVKGSWRKDNYTAELVFMDRLLAVIPFEVGDHFEEGISPVLLPNRGMPVVLTPDEPEERSFEDVMKKLDALVGLNEIKVKVREHAKYIQFLQLRREKGFDEKDQINIHSVFTGNPGTGKTTVARMMGKLYKKMGLLSKGHVHEVDRVDLVGEYIGQTAPKVKEAIEKARGGVLFIDEAYSLARSNDDSKDFGREVIEILVKEMSNGPGDMAVIVAGYPKEMKHFIDSNPGLKSRFKIYFEFADYLPQVLSQIAEYAALEKGVVLNEKARFKIDEIITESYRSRDRSFGNARFVYDIIEHAKLNMGLRVMNYPNPRSLPKDALSTIELGDVEKIRYTKIRELPSIPVDDALLTTSLDELNRLIGMATIKAQIMEMVSLVKYYRESGRDVLNTFFLHTVFIGNPGTGKTTVARILTKIYKSLGILERGHIVETDRQGLVAGYVGQTAIKTAEKIEESMGGVLFIDEAYALTSFSTGSHGDFGDEAIQTLLKRMEDRRGEFFVFVAGYPDNMELFLKANPGLSSRFDKVLKFEDYSPSELSEIAYQMIGEAELVLSPEAQEYLSEYLSFIYEYRDKYFGNARVVRGIVLDIIKNHNLRLAALTKVERDAINASYLTLDDVAFLKKDKSELTFTKKSIGYQAGKSNS